MRVKVPFQITGEAGGPPTRRQDARRRTLFAYCGLWLAVYAYALAAGAIAWHQNGSINQAADRFLPLLVVASVAALLVVRVGLRFRVRSTPRRLAQVPCAISMASVMVLCGLAYATLEHPLPPHVPPELEGPLRTDQTPGAGPDPAFGTVSI